MSDTASQPSRFRRYTAKGHRGISYRERSDGSRSYFVFFQDKYLPAGTTQQQALDLQASLRSRKARGERVVVASKRTVREVGEEWLEAERHRWKEDYANEQRRCLDVEVYAEFGDDLVASIGPREVIAFDRKLRARGLSASGAANIAKPLRGLLDHAVMCEDISVSPYTQVPRGKLSSSNARRRHHEWTTEQVEEFIRIAHEFDTRPEAKRKYGDQVECMIRLGLRIAEVSGLKFSDIDPDEKVIHVRRQFSQRGKVLDYAKTQAGRRRVPLTDDMLAKLQFRQSFYGLGDGDFVFADRPGGNPPGHLNFRRRAWDPSSGTWESSWRRASG